MSLKNRCSGLLKDSVSEWPGERCAASSVLVAALAPLCCQSPTNLHPSLCLSGAMRSLLHTGLSLLLASLAPSVVLAVITNQGPWGERVEEEVREFQGWIRGGEQDYVMTLAQVQDLLGGK